MKVNLYDFLSGNEYPGRGICTGVAPSGKKAMIVYFVMGRSANSRNRVFDPIKGGIRTKAADPSKMTDPHLIIYNPVLTFRKKTIVTNGDQTNTIYDFMKSNKFPKYNFEAALKTRTFEDDKPNWTPRISGLLDMKTGAYKISIIKNCGGKEKARSALFSIIQSRLPEKGTLSALTSATVIRFPVLKESLCVWPSMKMTPMNSRENYGRP